jgi:hypothetical protein
MNDTLKNPSRDLKLKLHWPSELGAPSGFRYVAVELQDVNGIAVASISVRCEQLLEAVTQKLARYPLISTDGFVSVVSDEFPEALPKDNAIALNQLVAEAISTDMLDDEPNVAHMLSELRTRLLKSLELVEKEISSLP